MTRRWKRESADRAGRSEWGARRWVLPGGALLAAGLISLGAHSHPQASAAPPASTAPVIELRVDDVIHPLVLEYLEGGFEQASRSNARLILITMNTPGGLDSAMRDIIQRILHSKIPVAIYVSPSGSRAASAGFFILLSADVAAMAPGTNTGAASPLLVNLFTRSPMQIDESLRRKVVEDATAYLRSIAGKRGRNFELAEKAVTEGKAFTYKEALDGKLIDLLAASPEELLGQLHGRTVTRFDGSSVTLDLAHPVRVQVEMSARQQFLSRVLRPDVFFVLLLLGVLGLYTEFSHPGLIVPGVIGGISLVLALFAMYILPVNAAGLLLIALAIALFILEAKFTSHGVLGLGGAVAMVLGALMLIRSPLTGMGVSLGVALGVTLPFALIIIFLMRLVLKSFKWKPSTGVEAMVGALGEVTERIEGKGMVLVQGELWRAVAREPIAKGARVRVVKVDGLSVHVVPAEPEQAARESPEGPSA